MKKRKIEDLLNDMSYILDKDIIKDDIGVDRWDFIIPKEYNIL